MEMESVDDFDITDKDNTDDRNGWHIQMIIPDTDKNLILVQRLMSFYGYFLSKKTNRLINDLDYAVIDFEPRFQFVVNEQLHDYKYVYHVAPKKFDNSILRKGLVPHNNKNILYEYPERIYFILNTDAVGDEVFTKSNFKKLCKKISREKVKTVNQYVNDNIYSVWRIELKDLFKSGVRLHMDYTEEDFCSLWTSENIRPTWIKKLGEVDLIEFIKNFKEENDEIIF